MATDWIEEEAERIRLENERQEKIHTQTQDMQMRINVVWDEMKRSLQEQVNTFNNNSTLQDRYHRKLDFKDDGWSGLSVSSSTFPAVRMIIKHDGKCVRLAWSVTTPTHLEKWTQNAEMNSRLVEHKDFDESMDILLGPSGELMFDGINGREDFAELSKYILRRFLVDPTVFPGMRF